MTRPLRRLARPVAVLALAATFAGSLGGLATAPGAPNAAVEGGPVAELGGHDAALLADERCAEPRGEHA